jgi:hypothetical protein
MATRNQTAEIGSREYFQERKRIAQAGLDATHRAQEGLRELVDTGSGDGARILSELHFAGGELRVLVAQLGHAARNSSIRLWGI